MLEMGGAEGRQLAAELEPLIGSQIQYEKLWKSDLDVFARESDSIRNGGDPLKGAGQNRAEREAYRS